MASPGRAIAFVAGVAAATTVALAQPIVSPREVADPAPAVKPAPAKPAAAKPAKPAKAAKSTKAAKPTKAAKSAKATKAKSAKATKPAAGKPAARVAAGTLRGGRGNNMPRGFAWPPTPAMQTQGRACEADLDTLGVAWKRTAVEGRISAPIEVPDGMLGGIKYTAKWRTPPHRLDCQLARQLARIGRDLHAIGVREVRWGSIYRWSNVRTQGGELPYLSRHALGLAMDIVEVVDQTGRVANVLQHYGGGDPLLAGIERIVNGSRGFRIMLTPRNDPKSHDDHFHVEANPDYTAP